MEPFGLFQILQSFLKQSPESAPQAEESDALKTENRSDEPAPSFNEQNTKPETTPQADLPNQAILSFIQAHETRAKRIKKP